MDVFTYIIQRPYIIFYCAMLCVAQTSMLSQDVCPPFCVASVTADNDISARMIRRTCPAATNSKQQQQIYLQQKHNKHNRHGY